MRLSLIRLAVFTFIVMIQSAYAQPMDQGQRRPMQPRELKFDYEADLTLFSSQEEVNQYNQKLVELKKSDPEAYAQIEKSLMEKMRPTPGQGRPDPESMKAKRAEMQKELKEALAEKSEEPKEVEAPVESLTVDPVILPAESEVAEEVVAPVTKEALVTEIKSAPTAAISPRNYKPETCVWAEDIPRKVVVGANCSTEGSRICIGYVVCEQKEGGGKFTRMSTCSEGLCGDNDASACTRQAGFGSFKPKADYAESVSPKIDDVLKNAAKGQ